MATETSNLQSFTNNWNKYAAWAQTQGIGYKDYYPVYQLDASRMLSGESPMSSSEVTRAILAAKNPKNVTPVPTDKPKVTSPSSLFGAAVGDLRNIFTGLDPTHLATDLWHSAENTLVHPMSWIKPIEDIGMGTVTGNLAEVKTGLNLATDTDSILQWLPGINNFINLGEMLANGGPENLLSHPIMTFLDLAPFAPAGKLVSVAMDDSRVAGAAAKVGMSADQFTRASVPQMLTRKFFSIPIDNLKGLPLVGDKVKTLTDAAGNPMTLGMSLSNMVQNATGMGKTAAALQEAALDLQDYATDSWKVLNEPSRKAVSGLDEDQFAELNAITNGTDPRTKGKLPGDIMAMGDIDEKVLLAYQTRNDYQTWVTDQAVATGAVSTVKRPDGSTAYVQTEGTDKAVLDASDAVRKATNDYIDRIKPANDAANTIARWNKDLQGLLSTMGKDGVKAAESAKRLDQTSKFEVDAGGKPKIVTLSIGKEAEQILVRVG